ncbi:hypothetical protein [Pseudorhodoferax soli]|uniref:Uncharacterized protein n=1 Tax=Pseudorhodoferax soli TaxID=545864 RepID=A0A368Y288_9BURK|nr:hypothetical protein [Pseudorhodoferax soli]RCW74215.1 hypothetical protein DES41_102536 [Pseudorhodoferax soli]
MQLPSVDRTVNGPAAAGADSQPAAGSPAAPAGTVARATREETRVLQERAVAEQPQPSIRVELSAEADALIRSGRAGEDEAATAAGAVMVAASAAVGQGGAQAGQTGAVPQKSSIEAATEAFEQRLQTDAAPTAETAEALGRYQATGQKPGPDQPSGPDDAAPKNWTEKPKVEEEEPPEPPKEPISKKLLDFLQSLWRAGGNAIDVAQTGNLTLNPPKEADSPVTYTDPSAKKTTGL